MGNVQKHFNFFTGILTTVMVLVYAVVGGLFLFLPNFAINITGYSRYILGIMLILYSVFRIYRLLKMWKVEDEEA